MTYTRWIEPYPVATRRDAWGSTVGRPSPHRGTDHAPGGVPALAWARGEVVLSTWSSILGNVVVLKHPDGFYSGVAHLAAPGIRVGSEVPILGQLGIAGNTGSASRGRHIHSTAGKTLRHIFEGATVNPLTMAQLYNDPETSAPASLDPKDWYTATQTDGKTGPVFWSMFQLWARANGYRGPIDGKPGKATWMGAQRSLKKHQGYRGPIDGIPGRETFKALQRWGRSAGGTCKYTGPIDGIPGKQTWRAIAWHLNRAF